MQTVADRSEAPTAIRTDLGAIFVSLELSRSTWLITSLWPGGGEKMSKQVVRGGDVAELLERSAIFATFLPQPSALALRMARQFRLICAPKACYLRACVVCARSRF
jgi:hypothetical protein